MSRLSAVPLSAATAARLHRPLLALHAAMEVDALWRAVRGVMRAAFAPHRVTLFLGHLGMGEARVVLTDPPIVHPEEWYAARGKLNPFSPFIETNRGVKFYRFADVLPPRADFVRTEFYRRFALPEGWDKGVSALFWERREVTAMFSLYRAPAQPDFDEAELALLRHLHPFVGTAIARVRRLHTERLARRGLEEFNRNVPMGLVFLDWSLRVEFANPEAHRCCARWNFGAEAARAYNPRDAFELPPAVLDACRALRAAVLARDPRGPNPQPGDVTHVEPAGDAGLRAQITVLNNPASALAQPRFLVVFDSRPVASPEAGAVSAEKMGQLRELTPRERELALLVCEGCTNAEIARGLNKSVLTIKKQLNSVFRKLRVKSRARMMALLR
ncbi:MAG: helix-turn-helix transcriptional regulator [Opitutaceae bacterium]|nr:helix-turn-helix transcriptional regulator [Opitutaceae bacterium]